MKYPPLFKRIPLNDEPNNIGIIQTEFEKFYKKISSLTPKTPEKTLALRKLQEACHFFCRAECIEHFKSDEDKPTVLKAKDKEPIKNQPKILMKKKKV